MALLNTPTFLLCVLAGVGVGSGMIYTHVGPGLIPKPPANTAAYRNQVRTSEVTQLANAIQSYRNDHKGSFPVTLSATPTQICISEGTNCTASHLIDLSFLAGPYIPMIPSDVDEESAYGSGFTLMQTSNGRIRVSAVHAELNQTIQTTF